LIMLQQLDNLKNQLQDFTLSNLLKALSMYITKVSLIGILNLRMCSLISFSILKLLILDLLHHSQDEMVVDSSRRSLVLKVIWPQKFMPRNSIAGHLLTCLLLQLYYSL